MFNSVYGFILSVVFLVLSASFANAQSGIGGIKGYVKCGAIGNDGCAVGRAKITLKPIENWAKTKFETVTETDAGGYFSEDVSFGEYKLTISADGYETYETTVYIPSSVGLNWAVRLHKGGKTVAKNKSFDGTWSFEETKNGQYSSLSLTLKQEGEKLTGEYGNVSSKESNGKILSAKVKGERAILEVDCDWGGRGTIEIKMLDNNRIQWKVVKRDESKGQFIVLENQILKKI